MFAFLGQDKSVEIIIFSTDIHQNIDYQNKLYNTEDMENVYPNIILPNIHHKYYRVICFQSQ